MSATHTRAMLLFIYERYDALIGNDRNRIVVYLEGHDRLYNRHKRDMKLMLYYLLPAIFSYVLIDNLSKIIFIFTRIEDHNLPFTWYSLHSMTFRHDEYYDQRYFRSLP